MSHSHTRRKQSRALLCLVLLNCGFAAACLLWWQVLGAFVADPISWATWAPLGRSGTPDYFRYPFGLLWMMPLAGTLIAWAAMKVDNRRLAHVSLLLPIVMLSFIFGWYYVAPIAWR